MASVRGKFSMVGGPDSKRNRIGAARRALAAKHQQDPERVTRFNARMAKLAVARRHQPPSSKRWCIICTASRSTVPLAETLERDGYDVWTPMRVTERRIGPSRKRQTNITPFMPTFLFAAADRVDDLLRLSADPTKDHASFRIFREGDRIPLIADKDLAALRSIEDNAALRRAADERSKKRRAEPFSIGCEIRISEGPFGGMTGLVDSSNERNTFICFGDKVVKVDTFILRTTALNDDHSIGAAA